MINEVLIKIRMIKEFLQKKRLIFRCNIIQTYDDFDQIIKHLNFIMIHTIAIKDYNDNLRDGLKSGDA